MYCYDHFVTVTSSGRMSIDHLDMPRHICAQGAGLFPKAMDVSLAPYLTPFLLPCQVVTRSRYTVAVIVGRTTPELILDGIRLRCLSAAWPAWYESHVIGNDALVGQIRYWQRQRLSIGQTTTLKGYCHVLGVEVNWWVEDIEQRVCIGVPPGETHRVRRRVWYTRSDPLHLMLDDPLSLHRNKSAHDPDVLTVCLNGHTTLHHRSLVESIVVGYPRCPIVCRTCITLGRSAGYISDELVLLGTRFVSDGREGFNWH